MSKRQTRLLAITEILTNNSIGSQEELLRLLAARGFFVTQATLSRDLKVLKTTKVVSELGGYRYIITDPTEIPDDEIYETVPTTANSAQSGTVEAMEFSGHIVVFRTQFGYASGLAYDLDHMTSPMILGTIAGADTVMVAMREELSREEIIELFAPMLPPDVLEATRRAYLEK